VTSGGGGVGGLGINTNRCTSFTFDLYLAEVHRSYLSLKCVLGTDERFFFITFRPMPRVINDISIYTLWSRVTQAPRALIHARAMVGITENLLCICGLVHDLRCRAFAVVSR